MSVKVGYHATSGREYVLGMNFAFFAVRIVGVELVFYIDSDNKILSKDYLRNIIVFPDNAKMVDIFRVFFISYIDNEKLVFIHKHKQVFHKILIKALPHKKLTQCYLRLGLTIENSPRKYCLESNLRTIVVVDPAFTHQDNKLLLLTHIVHGFHMEEFCVLF